MVANVVGPGMSCRSCAHSRAWQWDRSRLVCDRTGAPANRRCEWFSYEPGTDEKEFAENAKANERAR